MGPVVVFFALTYAVTWMFFLAALALSHQAAPSDPALAVARALVFVGTMTPGLAALVISLCIDGGSGAKALLRRLFLWRVGARWYVFALGYMAAIRLTVAVVHHLMTGSWPRLDNTLPGLAIVAIIMSTPFQSGEEIGWRGYALPHLAQRIGVAWASVLVGLIWAGWHLPLFFLLLPGNDEHGQSFPVWALGVMALSVAIAWLYTQTNGSLLLTMLMHSAVNNIPHFVSSPRGNAINTFSLHAPLVAWLTASLLWIAAAYLLCRMRHVVWSLPNANPAKRVPIRP